MVVFIGAVTRAGEEIQNKICENCQNILWVKKEREESLKDFVAKAFEYRAPLFFIGAMGIIVRMIAPFARDKFTDSPVLVADEKGEFVIPVLSGHLGGGNELASRIATKIGAISVITTATDVEHLFSVDVFAKRNGLKIVNREGIQRLSSQLLNGDRCSVYLDEGIESDLENLPKELYVTKSNSLNNSRTFWREQEYIADLLILSQDTYDAWTSEKEEINYQCFCKICLVIRPYALGIGCRRGKDFKELKAFVEQQLAKRELEVSMIGRMASIDLKEMEMGLQLLSQYYHIPFQTYSAKELRKAPGNFSRSEFVSEITGVDNVCERSGVLAADGGALWAPKLGENGMTFALAKRKLRILWKES